MTISLSDVTVGMQLPDRSHLATNVSLFLYNAAVWNPHRIHYDEEYATAVEGHAGVVIDGPLQGDWIAQVALNWVAESGTLVRFSYSNRLAAHLGDTLTSGGVVSAVDMESGEVELNLFIRNEAGDTITPGTAIVRFAP